MHFNLLEKPWIPVLSDKGKYARMSVLEVMQQSRNIRDLAAPNPMDRFAIFRFLLALLYWCADRTQVPLPESGEVFPKDWYEFLDQPENHGCFNLLGEGKRFYQVKNANRERPVTDLLHEIPTGNNFRHFNHTFDGEGGVCLDCSTMGLLRLPLYSVSGLPNLKSGVNGTPPIYVAPWSDNVFKTIMLNWHINSEVGTPVWVKAIHPSDINGELPLLNGLTALPRRIWLHQPIEADDRCVLCGEKKHWIIYKCENETAGTLETERWTDPHVLYLYEKDKRSQLKVSNMKDSGKFRFDRPWHELFNRLVEKHEKCRGLFAVGFCTSKADLIDVWERWLGLPEHIDELVSSTPWDKASFGMAARIDITDPNSNKRQNNLKKAPARTAHFAQKIRPHVEDAVSAHLDGLLNGTYTWNDAANEYTGPMQAVAASLAPGYTVSDMERQRKIKTIRPYIRSDEGDES